MRALLATSDKSGLVELGHELSNLGWEIVATSGTSQLLSAAGISVQQISDLTHTPEMLEGRVKTLHPKVFGGLLYRRGKPDHEADVARYDIVPIDLVACNFYPFDHFAALGSLSLDKMQNHIDIGGPALIRAAAKNFQWVIPLVDPADYNSIISGLRNSGGSPFGVTQEVRLSLAMKAFELTSRYDSAIFAYLSRIADDKALKS